MEIPQLDRSSYLKGLLITARKDKQLSETEISIIKKIATRLGFSSDFFEETISNLLNNKYITEEPIKFSRQDIAESFIEDGLKLALSDNNITEEETNWLRNTAKENGVDEEWVNKKMKEIQSKPHLIGKMDFALFSLI
ncbi:MAG: TerB family tellurite resistance protein [Ignavibacteriaceae bacterium]|nr:TerB family tellurite resistance protein [Ignavibacteriaceae bacterium]